MTTTQETTALRTRASEQSLQREVGWLETLLCACLGQELGGADAEFDRCVTPKPLQPLAQGEPGAIVFDHSNNGVLGARDHDTHGSAGVAQAHEARAPTRIAKVAGPQARTPLRYALAHSSR